MRKILFLLTLFSGCGVQPAHAEFGKPWTVTWDVMASKPCGDKICTEKKTYKRYFASKQDADLYLTNIDPSLRKGNYRITNDSIEVPDERDIVNDGSSMQPVEHKQCGPDPCE